MNTFRLEPPSVSKNTVSFRWSVAPRTSLYRATRFDLRFPESVEIASLPESLWWRIAILCLHSHWALLRPCRVELPARLVEGEAESWMRLIDAEVATLEAQRGTSDFGRTIEFRGEGPPLPPLPSLPENRRCASAFSGGKDSLLQAALLCELAGDPILVATTSPMPPMRDHETARRADVFRELAKRRRVSFVEVHSDFRATWDNGFARSLGYPVWVTEITDTFLYLSALVAVGMAKGVRHLFLASENEVQSTMERDGRTIQHTHCMYSVATLRAIEALLRPSNIVLSSTSAALRSAQVELLLQARYGDVWDLQYSCHDVGIDGAPCSRCSKCFRAALSALACGGSPRSLGIDLATLLPAMRHWTPPPGRASRTETHPGLTAQADLARQIVEYLAEIPASRVLSELRRSRPGGVTVREKARALFAFGRIRRRVSGRRSRSAPGYDAGFLAAADPIVRDGLETIFSTHFPADESPAAGEVFRRSDALSRWIAEPLRADSLNAP
jgi:hypothetical protein